MLRMHFKNSVAFKWKISYGVILFIPILISALIYVQTGSIVEYEIKRANKALLNQVKFIVDSGLLQTEQLGNQMSINTDIRKYLEVDQQKDPFQIYKTKQEIHKYLLYNDFIKDIFVYSKSMNMVLTPDTFVEESHFYQMYYESAIFTFKDWQKFARSNYIKEYRVLPTRDNGLLNETAALVQSLPIDNSNQPLGTLVITLNNNKIEKILKNMDWIQYGQVLILDKNDQIVFHTKDAGLPLSIHYSEMELKKDEPFFENVQGHKVMISHASSSVVDWKYVSMIPAEVFWERAEHIRNLNLLGLFICFIIGGVMILVFARKNYNPIQELVRFVTGKAFAPVEKEQDEFELIRQHFIKTIQERDDSNHKQVQHIKLLRNYFLHRLMKGHIEKEQSLEEASKAYHILWSSDYFLVMLFHLESDKGVSNEFQLLQFIISNVVTELIGSKHTLHFTDMDGTLAAVLNIHPAGFDDWKDNLESELKEAREFIEKRYNFQFATTISELQRGLGGIHQAFMQALEALEYLMLLGDEKVVWYGDLKHTNKDYYYTVNQELILINLLKSCDFIQARELVTGVIQSSFNQGNTSIEMLKCIMIDLVSTMMKLIQDQHNGSVWEELRPFRRLLKCNTKFEIEYQMLEIFNYVCQHIESKNKSISNLVKNEHVTEFVQENYHDPNLSVSLLGEHFSMTPQYLSRLFKEQRGQGLHEFICQTRIEHAKRLLLKGESIEDTARNTGFTSSSTFIKVFKKYEGITPGKYQFNEQ